VMDAAQHIKLEQWEPKDVGFRSVALDWKRRKAYFGAFHRKEIVAFEAEPAECSAPSEGLASFYAADGAGDDPVGAANLTLRGAARFGPGRVGQAFLLDGKSGFLEAPRTGHRVRFGYRDSSAVLYVKFSDLAGVMNIFDRSSDETPSHSALSKTRDNRFAFEFETARGGPLRLATSTSIAANRWYQVAVTKDDREITLYVDGNLEGQKPIGALRAAAAAYDEAPLFLGATGRRKQFLNGKLDEILFYNRALSATEIRDLYSMRESGPCRI